MIATSPDERGLRGGASPVWRVTLFPRVTLLRRVALFLLVTVLVGLFGAGCATNSAPLGWLDPPDAQQVTGFGSWTEVRYHDATRTRKAAGELLAVGRDSLFVMRAGACMGIQLSTVDAVKLTQYQAPTGAVQGWTLCGVISTASQGWWLVLTAPTWILIGSLCATATSHEAQVSLPLAWTETVTDRRWRRERLSPSESEAAFNAQSLRPYARFPQGFPSGIDLRTLLPKPPPPMLEPSSHLP